MGKRAGWGLADQAVSSLGNFGVATLTAHYVSTASLGAFGLAFGVYLLALATSRALGTNPLMIRFSSADETSWRRGTESATGTAILIALVWSGLCALYAFIAAGPTAKVMGALAVVLPGVLLQDSWRYAFFTQKRGAKAFVNDCFWTAGALGTMLFLTSNGHRTASAIVLGWGAPGLLAACLGMYQARLVPAPEKALAWLRTHSDISIRYVLEWVVLTASGQLSFMLIGVVAGLRALGGIKAGQVLLGPLGVLVMGASLVAVPEFSRRFQGEPRRLMRAAAIMSSVLVAATLIWPVVLVGFLPRLGMAMTGSSWEIARKSLAPLAVYSAGWAAVSGAIAALQSLGAAKQSLAAGTIFAPTVVIATTVGAALGGGEGAAWGLAFSSWVGVVTYWRQLLRKIKSSDQGQHKPTRRERNDGAINPPPAKLSRNERAIRKSRPIDFSRVLLRYGLFAWRLEARSGGKFQVRCS